MSDFTARTRSSYFEVKNLSAFTNWIKQFGLDCFTKSAQGSLVGFGGAISLPQVAPDTDQEIDFLGQLADHLREGQVAIVMEVGWDGMRYLSGMAWAINDKGESEAIDLNQIHDLGAKLGSGTRCEY